MNRLFITLLFILYCVSVLGQKIFINNLHVKQWDDKLVITYDLISNKKKQVFETGLLVINNSDTINIKSAVGDIGPNIKTGTGKQIIWYFENDQVFIDGKLEVSVLALPMDGKQLSYTRMLGLSAIFPGWGLCKMQEGKPYWITGAAYSGCMISSWFFNRKAVNSYDKYLASYQIDNRKALKLDWKRQKLTSEIMFYTAATIWSIDLILLTTKYLKIKKSRNNNINNLVVMPVSNKYYSGIAIHYNF